MKTPIITLLLCIAQIGFLHGQTPSEALINRKNKIVKFLNSHAPNNNSAYSQNAMEAGMLYAAIGNKDSAFYYLNISLDYCKTESPGCDEIYDPNILGFYHFNKYLKTKEWLSFEKRILNHFSKTFKGTNPALALQLIKASGADQSIRIYMLYDKSPKVLADAKKISEENTRLIKKIVKEMRFPGISEIGHSASDAAFILVQHADRDTMLQKTVLLRMKELIKLNNVNPEHYGYLLDRTLVNANKPQVYGTQFKDLKNKVLYPIEDSINVDKRRKEIGMPSLSTYVNSIMSF